MTRLMNAIELAYHISVVGLAMVLFALLTMGYWRYWWELMLDIIALTFILSIAWLGALGILTEGRK